VAQARLSKVQHEDASINRMQDYVEQFGFQLQTEITRGTLLKNIVVSTTPTLFLHGLSRLPVGFVLVDAQGDIRVWRGTLTDQSITLQATSTATVSVWVF